MVRSLTMHLEKTFGSLGLPHLWSPCVVSHLPLQALVSRHWSAIKGHGVSSSPGSHHQTYLSSYPPLSLGWVQDLELKHTLLWLPHKCLFWSAWEARRGDVSRWFLVTQGCLTSLSPLRLSWLLCDSLLSQPRGQVLRGCLKHTSNPGTL